MLGHVEAHVASLSVKSEAAARAPGAVGNAKKKASPCVSTSTPPYSAHACRIAERWSARADAYALGPSSFNNDVERSTSVKTKVTVPVGSSVRTRGSSVDRDERARRTLQETFPRTRADESPRRDYRVVFIPDCLSSDSTLAHG